MSFFVNKTSIISEKNDYKTFEEYINAIVYDYNYLRPNYTLNYKTPIELN